MYSTLDVALHERAVILRHALPIRAVGPGRHHLFGFGLTVSRIDVRPLVFEAENEMLAVLPSNWYREITLANDERAILFREGRPRAFLRPGTHRYFVFDSGVTLERYAVDAPMPELTDELAALIPSREYVACDVPAHARGLLFIGERFVRVVPPGRFTAWTRPDAKVAVRIVDVRRQTLSLAAQELMTRDKVTLRLSITAELTVEDVVTATLGTVDVRDSIYLAVQLAAREYVASVRLDDLLEGRNAMTRHLVDSVTPFARTLGVRVEQLGVKDVVLPGEMKALLNRVIEAEKEAAANVILRREEASATRLRASSAKMMAEQPVLLRLTELELLKDAAKSVGELRLVVGANAVESWLGAQLGTGSPRT